MAESMDSLKLQIKINMKELINQKKYEKAQQLLNQYKQITSDDIEAFSIQGVIYICQGEYLNAQQVIEQGLNVENNNFDLLFNLAYVFERVENFSQAYKYYKRAKEVCTDPVISKNIDEALNKLESKTAKKSKLIFFIKHNINSFVDDIVEELSLEYEIRFVKVKDLREIDQGMKWADLCWFEWCDELIGYGSKLDIARNKKIICRIHGYEVYTDFIRDVEWKYVDELIIVAPHIRRIFEERTQDKDKGKLKIDTVFCGVNVEKYPLNVKKKGFNLGYLGYINFKKNLPLTLDIFKKLHDLDSRYKLYLAGEFQDGRTLGYIKYFIREHNLTNHFFFDGWQTYEQKVQWFKKINYMVISSIDEGLCYAAAEGMCSGIKPILHNCEGIKDHYDSKYIFSSVDEAITMIQSSQYDSLEYRNFVKEKYDLRLEYQHLRDILNRLSK